jgi:kindlin 2
VKTFKSVVSLCKDLGIRYPEELSLCKPLSPEHLKKNYADQPKKKMLVEQNGNYHQNNQYIHPAPDTNTFIATHSNSFHGSDNSLDDRPFSCAPVAQRPTPPPHNHPQGGSTPISSPTGTLRHHTNGFNHTSFNDSSSSLGDFIENLAYSPRAPSPEAISRLVRPKTLVERARMNVG